MKAIDIVSVYYSGDSRPTYVLGAAWDEVVHYFTDYLCADRNSYLLPDGYSIAKDVTGASHIYPDADSYPMELVRVLDGDNYLPAMVDGLKTIPLSLAECAE